MSAFDAAASPQYVNVNTKQSGIEPQRATLSTDVRTQDQKNVDRSQTLNAPSYINAPRDPWEGLNPLVQFGTSDSSGSQPLVQFGTPEGSSSHPKAPPSSQQGMYGKV